MYERAICAAPARSLWLASLILHSGMRLSSSLDRCAKQLRPQTHHTSCAQALESVGPTFLRHPTANTALERRILHRLAALRRLSRELRKDRKSTRLNSSHMSISYAVF